MGIFTGGFISDAWLVQICWKKQPDIRGTADLGAKQMFASLQRFKQLPNYLQVWPAHGAGSACGKALGAVPSSTVGYKKCSIGRCNLQKKSLLLTLY